jgi:hypothetical protein
MAGLLDSVQVDPNALAGTLPDLSGSIPSPSLWQRLQNGFDTFETGYNKFNNGVGAGMQSPLFNLGLGLMSAAQPFADPGKSIQGAMGNMLAQQGQRLQNAQGLTSMGLMADALQKAHIQLPAGVQQYLQQQGLMPPADTPQSGLFAPAPPTAAPAQTAAINPPVQATQPIADPLQPYLQQYDTGMQLVSSPAAQYLPYLRAQGQAMMDEAKLRIANDPGLATRMEAAKGQLAQDQYAIQQAQASGDPGALQAAAVRYLTDAKRVNVASYNGAVTTLGIGPNGQLDTSTLNPVQGVRTLNGVESPIPGAPQTQAALAGAKAGAESGAQYAPVYDAQGKQIGFAPRASILSQAPAAAASTATPGAGAGGVSFGIGPAQQAQLAKTGEESGSYLSELQTQADNATNANYALDQMATAARNVVLGPAAPARQWAENAAATLGQLFGVTPSGKELTNYQELDKYANQIAFAATRQMGSREAAQIVHLQMQSNPNKSLMPQAFSGLVQSMRAMNSYIQAKNTAIQGVASDKASALQAASTWTSKIDPRVWDLSLGPQLASRFATQIGAPKIATALPVMANDDAIAVMRNLPQTMRAQVLRGLPVSVKQQILQGLTQPASAGATWTF